VPRHGASVIDPRMERSPVDRMRELLADLLRCLDLEPGGEDEFLGHSERDRHGRIYGGQVIAQALMAAARTTTERLPHSLHAYFLRPGDPARPVVYRVERTRDGRSFTTRRVVALQGEPIFEMSASFHGTETGDEHHAPMPDAPPPEDLLEPHLLVAQMLDRIPEDCAWAKEPRAIEMRHVHAPTFLGGGRGHGPNLAWFRAPGPIPEDPLLHQILLAYATDFTFNDNALRRHGRTGRPGRPMMASLDHSIWLHEPARVDDWLLFLQESPRAGGGRGFVRGEIFTRAGRHVASVAQEALLRRV
jgi:acyl-CoA thioesterase II